MKEFLFLLIFGNFLISAAFGQSKENMDKINPRLLELTLQPITVKNVKEVQQILEVAQKNKLDFDVARAKVYIGHYYAETESYEKALKTFQEVYKIGEVQSDSAYIIDANYGLGKVYDYMDIPSYALDYYQKAEQLSLAASDNEILDDIYDAIGRIHQDSGKLEKALTYMLKGRDISLGQTSFKDEFLLANSNIGAIYVELGEAARALPYFEEHLEYAKSQKDTLYLAYTYRNMGYAYTYIPDFEKAFMYFDTSLYYSELFQQDDETFATYSDMSKAYQAMGEYQKGLEYEKKYHDLQKEVIDRLTRRQVTALEIKFETEKKEKELLLTQKQLDNATMERQRMGLIMCILLAALLIGGILFFKAKEDAQKKQSLQKAKEELIQQQLEIKQLQAKELQNQVNNQKKDLTNLALDISRRNEFSNLIINHIETLQKTKPEVISSKLREMLLFTANHLRINEDLAQFQRNIEDINQEFYQKLEAQFGPLSKNEKYLCGLIRLNLSNKDIAALRGISAGSAKVNRYRLRKKLGLKSSTNIITFLQQF